MIETPAPLSDEQKALRIARAYVRDLRSYYLSIATAVGVLSIIWLVNFLNFKSKAGWWAVWPTLVWGMVLVFKGISLAAESRGWLFGAAWEERKVQELLKRR
jgi:hypothetical protein